jgi:hypothetical protein
MPIEPGRTLGHYRIVAALGAGGMGEVYRATDTRLGRDVAIKALPADLADQPERLARFRREAQLLASLNHPNIGSIHGLEEIDRRPFLALELVEGETLAARLERGAIPLEEALDLAGQIASGLEEAHEKGIVHRDLKPANVAVTADGKVKILDFGLAKALEEDQAGSGAHHDLSQSPTLTGLAGTRAGVILGTAAYMSPEQARGKTVDKRSDIWAFGVVLFEMLSGRQAFGGETVSDVLAAVLTRDPGLDALPAAPQALRRLLARCLVRDPKRRLRDIGEARIALQEIVAGGPETEPPQGAPVAVTSPGRRTAVLAVGGVLLAAIALAAGFVLGGRRDASAPTSGRTIRFTLAPPGGVEEIWAPSVAPDGSFVVYEGRTGGKSTLVLQRFDEMTPRVLQGTEGAYGPFISPDGRWIGFHRGTEILKVAASGGEPLVVGNVAGSFPGAAWLRDGTILFAPAWLGGLSTISANGGEARTLTTPDAARGEKGHWWPRLLPDDQHALFTIWRAGSGLNDASVAVVDLASGTYRVLFAGADAWYLPPDRIVYYRAGAYHAAPFDAATLQVTGEAVPFLTNVTTLHPAGDEHMPLAAGADGTLVYTSSEQRFEAKLAWVAPGREPEMLPVPARRYVDSDLSPDGLTLAVSCLEAGRFDIRLVDLRGGTEQRLDLPGSDWTVKWNPRGAGLAYRSMRKGDFDAYMLDIAAGGSEQPLLTGDSDTTIQAWTPDGRHLLYIDTMEGSRGMKMLQVPGAGAPEMLGDWRAAESFTSVSPDGHWAAYQSNESGRPEIYVRPLPGPGATTRLTREGGRAPVFAHDGALFFLEGARIMQAQFGVEAGRFVARGERLVLEAPIVSGSAWLNTLDGRRFLVPLRVAEPAPPRLQVVMNASEEVGRIPGTR